MQNRLRMVSASLPVKHLGIDWRRREPDFAREPLEGPARCVIGRDCQAPFVDHAEARGAAPARYSGFGPR